MEWTLYKDEPSLAKTVHGILIKTNQTKSWENTANVLVLVMIPDRSVSLQNLFVRGLKPSEQQQQTKALVRLGGACFLFL